MRQQAWCLILVWVAVVFSTPTARADACSEGCEETIAYRCERPNHKQHGHLWCCDYKCGGRSTAGALTICERNCRRPYGICKKASVDDLSAEDLGKNVGKNYIAIGEDNVKQWEESTATARQGFDNALDVPDPDAFSDAEMAQRIPRKRTVLEPGTRLGNATFMGASTSNEILVKRCDVKLKRSVVESISGEEYFNQLSNAAKSDPSVRDELRRQIQKKR